MAMNVESTSTFRPIEVSILQGLESAGDTISRQGHIDIDAVSMGGHHFELADGLSYDVALTNTGEGILATGTVKGNATVPCDRCLDPADVDILGEVSCYYLRTMPRQDEEDDEVYGQISPSGTVDLADAIHSAVVMDLPYTVLCTGDCQGLCPECGANLNHGDCGCDAAATAESAARGTSPFAVLSQLKFDSGNGASGD